MLGDEPPRRGRSIAELRSLAADHAKQLESVRWLRVAELSARWGISAAVIRAISREVLPYLMFGQTRQRRYDPRDVEAFEATRHVPAEH